MQVINHVIFEENNNIETNSYFFSFRFFVLDEADGLLKQGYTELIDRLHKQIPKITSDGKRLQMIVCSATLHAFEVKKMAVSDRDVSLSLDTIDEMAS